MVVSPSSILHPPSSILLHFTVTDTGIGIPREKHQAIFQPFEQADSSAARRYGGTGLGLAISSQLVAMMGGRIWVESEVGKQSTFHFTAAFGLPEEQTVARKTEELPNLRDMSVLLVDDNATSRRILAEILVNWHMKPTTAASGEEALAALRQAATAGASFPLVLLDAVIPGVDSFALAEQIGRERGLAGAVVMMLESADRQGAAARCRELGIHNYLVKPFKRSELLNTLLTAQTRRQGDRETGRQGEDGGSRIENGSKLDREPRSSILHSPSSILHPPSSLSATRPLRILLAEDNALNQRLAVRILEKHGHAVTVAADGKKALALLGIGEFDLVLMDVQMPEMDGLETTSLIRAREKETGGHVPIIAMTAHALKGDRERCLSAGMDGYVAKPILAQELLRAIAELAPSAQDKGSGTLSAAEKVPDPLSDPLSPRSQTEFGNVSLGTIFDRSVASARVGGDEALLQEIAGLFLTEGPRLLSELHDAITAGDSVEVRCVAHTLNGAVSTFGGGSAAKAASTLEMMGKTGELAGAEECYIALAKMVDQLKTELSGPEGIVQKALPDVG